MLKLSNKGRLKNIKPNNFLLGFFCFLFFTQLGYTQKIIQKSWEGSAFEILEIISDEVFKIEIITGDFSEIRLHVNITGENFESMTIGVSEKNKVLTLKPSFRPFFVPQNDKLAAHKMLSIEMTLYLPEQKKVVVDSKLASLVTKGSFQKLDVNLRDGTCLLQEFSGNAVVNTQQGDISVFAKPFVYGTAMSKHGKVTNRLTNIGNYTLKAQSVNGNISLYQSPE